MVCPPHTDVTSRGDGPYAMRRWMVSRAMMRIFDDGVSQASFKGRKYLSASRSSGRSGVLQHEGHPTAYTLVQVSGGRGVSGGGTC